MFFFSPRLRLSREQRRIALLRIIDAALEVIGDRADDNISVVGDESTTTHGASVATHYESGSTTNDSSISDMGDSFVLAEDDPSGRAATIVNTTTTSSEDN